MVQSITSKIVSLEDSLYQKLSIPISLARLSQEASAIEVTAMIRIQGRIALILAAVSRPFSPSGIRISIRIRSAETACTRDRAC